MVSFITSWHTPEEPISSGCHLCCWEPISAVSHSVFQNFSEAWFVLEHRLCVFGNVIILVICFPDAGWALCAGYLKPKMHLFKHTLHRTKCLRPLSCNKLLLKSFGHLVLRFAVVLGHHEPFILGMNSRHWHCFSEEDSIGMIKKVSATVSGRFMEKFLIKVARLRPEFRKNALFFCLVLVKSWKKS